MDCREGLMLPVLAWAGLSLYVPGDLSLMPGPLRVHAVLAATSRLRATFGGHRPGGIDSLKFGLHFKHLPLAGPQSSPAVVNTTVPSWSSPLAGCGIGRVSGSAA